MRNTECVAMRYRSLAPIWLLGTVGIGSGVLCLLALTFGCSRTKPSTTDQVAETTPPPGWFENITDLSGLNFVHDPGPTGTYFMPQSMGSGAACLDFDGDGLLDLYLLSFGGPDSKATNRLYRQ